MAKTKILFLSDNEEKFNEIDTLLGRNTYDLYFENTEESCLKFLMTEAPEVIIIDNDLKNVDLRFLPKKITSARDGIIVIIVSKEDNIPQEILRWADAFLIGEFSGKVLASTINSNLRNKLSYNLLAETNKNNTKSLYTLKKPFWHESRRLILSCFFTLLIVLSIVSLGKMSNYVSRLFLIIFC